jgi:hypothetical protein
MGQKPIKLNNSLTVNGHLAKHARLNVQQLFILFMEIKVGITTELAIKELIAIVACITIVHLIKNVQNTFGIAGAMIFWRHCICNWNMQNASTVCICPQVNDQNTN